MKVIIDTDFSSDVGDLGLLSLMAAAHRLGLAEIVGVVCNVSATKAPGAIDATLTAWGVDPLPPIGTWKGTTQDPNGPGAWMTGIYDTYPRTTGLASTVPNATTVYRELLAAAVTGGYKVDILSVGLMSNLAALLASAGDGISALDGSALVAAAVRELWVMGGKFPEGGTEWNLEQDPAAASAVAADWPTPSYWCGFDEGNTFKVGAGTAALPVGNIVRYGYNVAGAEGVGREAWDELTALGWITRGAGFDIVRGNITVNASTGENGWEDASTGSAHYITKARPDAHYCDQINFLIYADPDDMPTEWPADRVKLVSFT